MHPNLKLLSNSGIDVFHKCPRKYELDRMLPGREGHTIHTIFGHVVGLGVQELLTHGSRDRAAFAMFRAWEWDIEYEDWESQKAKKSFWYALNALDCFQLPRRNEFGNMVLAYLNGKPATEVGFTIDCGGGFYYRGYIDALLLDQSRREVVVMECKTTKSRDVHDAMYKHSGQALGYSLIVDMIVKQLEMEAASSYKVYYPVFKTLEKEWQVVPFVKKHAQRAYWIRHLLLDIERLTEYGSIEMFPMYGHSCFDFFQPCTHFGRCETSNQWLFKEDEVKVREDADVRKGKYDFHFSLDEIVEQQLALTA